MKQELILIFLVALIPLVTAAQRKAYVINDTSYLQVRAYDRATYKNNREVTMKLGGKTITYIPGQILEYGFMKGDVYVTRAVEAAGNASRYFLLRRVNGDRKLYELREEKGSRFFIEHDGSIVEIRKEDLREQLDRLLGHCGSYQNIASMARHSRLSLSRAVALNNRCFTGLLPRLRFGVLAGYERLTFPLTSNANYVSFKGDGRSRVAGIFIDFPIGLSRHWAVNIGTNYQRSSFTGFQVDSVGEHDYQFGFSAVSIPALVKHRSAALKWRPFVGFGVTTAINSQRENSLLNVKSNGSTIYVEDRNLDEVKRTQANAVLCGGFEYSLTQRTAISLELRFGKLIEAGTGQSGALGFIASLYF